jgi:hypothetical protein
MLPKGIAGIGISQDLRHILSDEERIPVDLDHPDRMIRIRENL